LKTSVKGIVREGLRSGLIGRVQPA
jgi:hypothetical protein